MPGLTPAILQLAGSQSSNMMNQLQQYSNSAASYFMQKKLNDAAYAHDVDMWNRANEYNSPASQMQRLKVAGLNPNLAYGSGSVAGNTTSQLPKYQAISAPEMPSPERSVNVPDVLSRFQDYKIKQAQVDNLAEQNQSLKADNARKLLENDYLQSTLTTRVLQTKLKQLGVDSDSRRKEEEYLMSNIKSSIMRNNYNALESSELAKYQLNSQKLFQTKRMDALEYVIKQTEANYAKRGLSKSDDLFLRLISLDERTKNSNLLNYHLLERGASTLSDLLPRMKLDFKSYNSKRSLQHTIK